MDVFQASIFLKGTFFAVLREGYKPWLFLRCFWGVGEENAEKFSWKQVGACFLLRRTYAIPTSLRAWASNAQRIASTYIWSMFPGKNFGRSKFWILGVCVNLFCLNPSTSETLPKWQPIHRNKNQLQKSDVSSLAKSFQRLHMPWEYHSHVSTRRVAYELRKIYSQFFWLKVPLKNIAPSFFGWWFLTQQTGQIRLSSVRFVAPEWGSWWFHEHLTEGVWATSFLTQLILVTPSFNKIQLRKGTLSPNKYRASTRWQLKTSWILVFFLSLSLNLCSKLLESDDPLVEVGPLLKQCTEGVLEGLNYLHTQNPPVVHRSLGMKRFWCPWKLVMIISKLVLFHPILGDLQPSYSAYPSINCLVTKGGICSPWKLKIFSPKEVDDGVITQTANW